MSHRQVPHGMALTEALEILGLDWPRDNKLTCPTGHSSEGVKSTPSLHLYEKTDSFYCFSCGATGDAYGLIALWTHTEIVEVLKQYGDGPSGKLAHPPISRTDMYKSAIARWQDYQGKWWPRFHALLADVDEVTVQTFIDHATFLPDEMWGGPLTLRYVEDAELTPAALDREVSEAIEWLDHCYERVGNYLGVIPESDILRPALQSTVPHAGGSGRSSVRSSLSAGQVGTIRVEPSQGVDGSDVGRPQTPARLLLRRLSS